MNRFFRLAGAAIMLTLLVIVFGNTTGTLAGNLHATAADQMLPKSSLW